MNQALFRHEALDFNREKAYGEVIVARSPSRALLAAISVTIAAALVAFAFWGEYTRKARVVGYLAPNQGLIKVHSPQTGTLIEKHVKEGQRVKQGDTLFVLSTEHGSRESAQAQMAAMQTIRERQQRLQQEIGKQDALDQIALRATQERIRSTQTELKQLEDEIAIQAQRTASAANSYARYRKLREENFVSPAQAQQQREELLEQRARAQSLQRSRTALERDLAALQQELAAHELKAHNQRSAIERDIAALQQDFTEYESRRAVVIAAPVDGTVSAILAERGQSAQAQALLLSILPDGALLHAQLLVPSRGIGFIAPAQTVALRYQAFPYQRFGSQHGRVTEISRTLIAPNEADLPVAVQEPVYRVTVALERQTLSAQSRELPLQAGMLLEADVQLDRQRLIRWLFEPLFSLTKRG